MPGKPEAHYPLEKLEILNGNECGRLTLVSCTTSKYVSRNTKVPITFAGKTMSNWVGFLLDTQDLMLRHAQHLTCRNTAYLEVFLQ